MEHKEIVEIVNQIMTEEFEIEAGLLEPTALLGENLDLDSLDAVDLVVLLEKKFSLRIQESEARAMATLQDIYDYIGNCFQEKKESESL